MSRSKTMAPRSLMAMAVLALAVVAATLALAGSPAWAASVTNGDFENGNLNGFTVANQRGSDGDWFAYSNADPPTDSCSGVLEPPPQGDFAATTDQDSPGSHVLYQDIALKTNAKHRLSFTLYYESDDPIASPNTLNYTINQENQQYRVDIMKPGAPVFSVAPDDVLATVFRTRAGDPQTLAPTRISFDLTRFAGRTVRLRFAEVDNQNCFNASVDAIKVATEIPPKPACNDGRDNDGDGKKDLNDPGCSSKRDDSERNPKPDPGPPSCTIRGTNGDDTLQGTNKRDVICARGGDDTVQALDGDDVVFGGSGNDSINGGDGRDVIKGGKGNDAINGGSGKDQVDAGPGENASTR